MDFKIFRRIGLLAGFLGASCAFAQDTSTQTLRLKVDIEPVFFVESAPEEGASLLLGPILPHMGPAVRRAKVVIHTNQPGPYQIRQWLEQKLTSEEGVDLEEIQFTVSDGKEAGRS